MPGDRIVPFWAIGAGRERARTCRWGRYLRRPAGKWQVRPSRRTRLPGLAGRAHLLPFPAPFPLLQSRHPAQQQSLLPDISLIYTASKFRKASLSGVHILRICAVRRIYGASRVCVVSSPGCLAVARNRSAPLSTGGARGTCTGQPRSFANGCAEISSIRNRFGLQHDGEGNHCSQM